MKTNTKGRKAKKQDMRQRRWRKSQKRRKKWGRKTSSNQMCSCYEFYMKSSHIIYNQTDSEKNNYKHIITVKAVGTESRPQCVYTISTLIFFLTILQKSPQPGQHWCFTMPARWSSQRTIRWTVVEGRIISCFITRLWQRLSCGGKIKLCSRNNLWYC